ncbi:MAG: GAF domain-containing protein [Anaerolineae bacterium]|jgi:hypothetical protein
MPDTRQPSEITEFQDWQARALNVLLFALTLTATPVIIFVGVEAIRAPERGAAAPLFGALYVFLVLLTVLRRLPQRIRLIGFLIVGYAVAVTAFLRGGLVGDGRLFLMILPLMALALSDLRMGLAAGICSLLIHLAFVLFAHLGWLSQWVVVKENPLALGDWLTATAVFLMLLAGLFVIVGLSNRSLIRALEASRQLAQERAAAYNLLEGQTRELERRTRWLEAATHAAREAATLEEPDVLLSRVAEELARRMDLEEVIFYTAGPEGELVARAMAESRQVVPVDVMPSGASPLAREALQSGAVRSGWWGGLYEVASPLRLQERTLGVMVVRFPTEIRMDGAEAVVLGLIANQLAVALENARLFSETRASLRELEALYRRYTTQAWERFVREAPESVRLWTGPEEVPEGVWQGLFEQARASGSVAVGEEDSRYLLAVPVKLRGVAIGVLGFHREQAAGRWRPEEIAAAETVAERLALAVENARLLEEAQRRAAREHLVAEITARLRASLDPDTVLKTTVRELGRALRARWAAVEITGPLQEGTGRSQEVGG